MADSEVLVQLTREEAFVLADYLSRWDGLGPLPEFADKAERVAVNNLLCLLEKESEGVLFGSRDEYSERLDSARATLRGQDG